MPSGYNTPISSSIAAALTGMGISLSDGAFSNDAGQNLTRTYDPPRSKKTVLAKKVRTQPSFIFLSDEFASFFEVIFGEKWAEDLDAQFYYMLQANGYKYERQMKEAFEKIENKLKEKGS